MRRAGDKGHEYLQRTVANGTTTKEYLEKIFESIGQPVFVKSSNHKLMYVNGAFCEFVGKTREEILEGNGEAFIHEDELRRVIESDIETLEKGKKVIFDQTFNYIDVGLRHVKATKNVFTNSEGDTFIVGIIQDVTEQKELELKLHDTIAKTREIINSVQEGIIVYGPDLTYQQWNPFMEKISGYRAEDVLGKNPSDIFPFLEEQGVLEKLKSILNGGPAFTMEFPYDVKGKDKSGYAIDTSQALIDSDGNIIGVLGVVHDITEKVNAEKLIKDSEYFFRESQEKAFIGSYRANFKTGTWESSEVMNKIFGIDDSYHKCIEGWVELVHPDDRSMMIDYVNNEILLKGGKFDKEYRIVRRNDGECRWVHGLGELIFDENREVNYLSGTIQDITERKEIEHRLKQSEDSYRILVENSQDVIFTLKTDGIFDFVSPAWTKSIGHPLNEVRGHHFTQFVHPDDIAGCAEVLKKVVESGEQQDTVEFRVMHINGTYRWYYSSAIPIKDEDGNVVLFEGIGRDVHDIKCAEKEREQFMKFFQIGIDIMVIADPLGCFQKINPACLNTLGYDENELLSKPFLDFIHPDDKQQTVEEMSQQMKIGYSMDFVNRYLCKDGTYKWLSWRAIHVKEEGITYATARDITESRIAEEKLQTIKNLLLSITNGTTDAIFTKDKDGKYTFVNEATARYMGKEMCEIIGKDDTELFPELDAAYIMNTDKKAMLGGVAKTYHEVAKTSVGEETAFLSTKGPLFDKSGKLSGLFGISRDITGMKRAEIEMKRLNRTLKMISECNQVLLHFQTEKEVLSKICDIIIQHGGYLMSWIGYALHDADKSIVPVAQSGFEEGYLRAISISWNAEIERGQGPIGIAIRDKKPVVARNIRTNPTFYPWREEALKRGYSSSIALPLVDGDEAIGALSVYSKEQGVFGEEEISLLKKLADNISYSIQFIRAKEEKKKSEELLRKSEEQLQIRQRMDSLGTLAGGISHDFNNLLTGIMGYLDLLSSDGTLSERNQKFVDNALKSSGRAAELIKQLQNLSRNTISEKTSVDLFSVAKEVFGLLDKTTDKLVEKSIEFEKGEYFVNGSASELHQVLLNLGTNAYKAIEERGVKEGDYIKICANLHNILENDETGLPRGEYVHISFEDNGRGMSDEVARKAFDPLFTTRDMGGQRGQGLGLAMVYNIISRGHNGHIKIESKVGVGTKMHIYLPKTMPMERSEIKEKANKPDGHGTILVIEDELMIQEFVKTVLETNGYNVLTANDGKQGLDIYMQNINSIDLVVLDLTMPRMSGQTVLEKMIELKENVKVIISSGQNNEETRGGVLTKAKGYIGKPYRVDALTNMVKSALEEE